MQLLSQSAAATTIVGPVLDSTGAAYTGLVIGDLNITKNGTTAAMAAAATLTHDHNGMYLLVFTTGNTDTLGRADISCNKATYAMPPKSFEVVTTAVFNALVTNGTLASSTSGRTIVVDAAGLVDANVVKVGPTGAGTAQTARDIGLAVPAVAAGASGGLLISGSNTGTTTFGALTVTGATTLAALSMTTLTASGAVAFQSTFAVTTSTSLAALSCTTLTASGAVAFQSTFAVTTSTSLAALSCTTLTASGAVAFQSTFATTGTTTFNAFTITNNLLVSGTTTHTGATTFTGAVTGTNASNDLRINGAVPGASGGLFIAGTNAATTVTTSFTTTFTGNLTGSVGSVTGSVGSVTGAVGSVTGNVGGNVTGSVGSVVGAVGSVTGAVGSVTGNVGGNVVGSVASVTARVTANTDQLAGQTVTAAAGVTFPGTVASPTNITAVGTVTDLTQFASDYSQGLLACNVLDLEVGTNAAFQAWANATRTLTAFAFTVNTAANATETAIKAKTDNLPAAPAAVGDVPTVAQIWATALAEAYRADGATGTGAQLLYEILQNLTEFGIAGVTKTVKKIDGSTTAATYTLDSATAPTAITRST